MNRVIAAAPRAWLALALLAICWPLNWMLPGPRTAYLFFPLWLGYILAMDVLVQVRTGTSLWLRSRKQFVFVFLASAPAWWLFEAINWRTGNWDYLGDDLFPPVQRRILSTISFATVMPAVFETAELVRSFQWVQRFASRRRIAATRRLYVGLLLAGLVMLTLTLIWPTYCYPFVWTSLVFILEPLNGWLGHRHLLGKLDHGDWRNVISLSVGALICGFFWEMWNYYSFPKWIYHTPGAEFLHIFEMPLLGYGGYIPFALELYALKCLFWPSRWCDGPGEPCEAGLSR